MALNIKDKATDALAREVADLAGETITEAVNTALAERKERLVKAKRKPGELAERLMEIGRRCAALPDLDDRTEGEILGYDENGIPT
jgi:antitoxin VapB